MWPYNKRVREESETSCKTGADSKKSDKLLGLTSSTLLAPEPQLIRALSATAAASLVIGIVIGAGVFLKAAVMAQSVGTPVLVLSAWFGAGILSLAGALSYAELGGLLPYVGGEYVYLRAAYGNGPAFLYGWMRMTVGSAGGIASLAVGFSTFLSTLIPLNSVWAEHTFHLVGQTIHWQVGTKQIVAVILILLISGINCAGVAFGGHVQSLITGIKLLGIAIIVGGVFFLGQVHLGNLRASTGTPHWAGMSAFSVAMLGALWAYDGWNQMPMVAGEVQNPQRNIPRALVTGMIVVTLIYVILNLCYFLVLPFNDVVSSNSTLYRDAMPVAAKAAQSFLGSFGGRLISIIFLVSTLGALNGNILACARIPYAMARDGLFFSRFGTVTRRTRAPVFSIVVQAIWAGVLAMSGTFDQLTDCVLVASWMFYALVVSSVFVLRRKMPDVPRPYRTFGYPLVPIIFIATASWLILNTLRTRPVESAVGLLLIAAGVPFYRYFRRER